MQTKQLVFLLLLLLLVQLSCVLASCPKGFFRINNPRNPCSVCFYGQYCPGDDNAYDCPTGYAAPNEGMSACTKCQSNRSNADATVCLLVDTPPQAQESLDDPNDDTLDLYKIDKKASNWFTTVLVGDLSQNRSLPIQYGFNCANRKENVPLTVFASVKTGAPSKSNYQWMATGLNATLVVTVDWIDPNAEFIVIYFTFIPSVDYTVPFLGTTFKRFAGEITAVPNQLVVGEFLDFSDPINQAVVEWNNIPSMSKVNVSIIFEDLTHESDKYLTYSLCYSNLPTIAYPNTFNSNLVVSNKVNSQTTRTLDKVSGPSLRIGVIGGQISDVRISAKLIILK